MQPRQVIEKAISLNKHLPLNQYFIPMVGEKKKVNILDIGSGPFPITGQLLEGVEVEIHYCDQKDFKDFWKITGVEPVFPIEYQNMEKLNYADNVFDIVHCVNALDHTPDALAALKEMIRVCKVGGWVYIDCALDQLTTQRKKHYWDAKEDGRLVNLKDSFDLKEFGFSIEYVDMGYNERRYNHIIAKKQKV